MRMHVSLCLTKKRKRPDVNGGRCRLTWLKRCGSTVSGRALVRPDSCQTDREIVKTMKNQKRLWGGEEGTDSKFQSATLVAAQSIQPLPLGSMLSSTRPSTMSGKIS